MKSAIKLGLAAALLASTGCLQTVGLPDSTDAGTEPRLDAAAFADANVIERADAALAGMDAAGPSDASAGPDAALLPDASSAVDAAIPPDASVPFPSGYCNSAGWCWEMPRPHGDAITAVWGTGTDNLWATTGGGRVLHHDGTDWSVAAESSGRLWELSASGPDDLWASGTTGALHWDGSGWSIAHLPQTTNSHTRVYASAPQTAWAFEAPLVVPAVYSAWMDQWDGSQWSAQPPLDGSVRKAWAQSANDIWAVGFPTQATPASVWHFDGTSWAPQTISPGTGYDLWSVWAYGAEAWVLAGTSDSECTLFHFDGSKWVDFREVPPAFPSVCGQVWGSSPSDIWTTSAAGELDHWDGQSWTTMTTPLFGRPYGLYGSSANSVWASASGPSVTHWDGTAWTEVSPPQDRIMGAAEPYTMWPGELNTIWCNSAEPVAAGKGIVLTRGPTSWTTSWQGAQSQSISAIWGPDGTDDLWAVGSGGLILKRSNDIWQQQSSPTTNTLRAIWGRSASDIWAVGESSTVLHFDGSWHMVNVWLSGDLLALWGDPSGVLRVLASDGSVFGWDGTSWAALSNPIPATYYAGSVWGTSVDDLWVALSVGGFSFPNDVLVHWDGQAWTTISSASILNWTTTNGFPAGATQMSVMGFAASDVYVLGYSETLGGSSLYHWDGSTWTEEFITGNWLWGICGTKQRGLWVAGGIGEYSEPVSILHRPLP